MRRCKLSAKNISFALMIVAIGLILINGGAVQAEENSKELWAKLRQPNHVALLRHALAPGTGDPPQFRLGDCTTQRNLNDRGREQAARIGARFRDHNLSPARVYSSQWCRCLETARLLDLGPVKELPILNSFFRQYERRQSQTRDLREWLDKDALDEPVILVTHQVNITALTGVYPSSGELVIIRVSPGGDVSVIGTIKTD